MNVPRQRCVAGARAFTLAALWLLALACLPIAVAHADEGAPVTTALPTAAPIKGADVKLHDTLVFRLWVDHLQETAASRARSASQALETALDAGRADVRITPQEDARVIYVGDTPVIELYPEDARATGNASLDVYAAKVGSRVREAFGAEKKRSDIAATVFSFSLVVFFGFMALYVLRKIGELAKRSREVMIEHPERIASVRLNTIEVIGAGPLRALLLAAVILGRWVLQISVVYVWLVLSLSRFDLTRPLTSRLTSSLIGPVTSLAQRALSALPLGLLTAALAVSVYVVLRFIELFFAGVSRGQERASWVPRDLVTPTSALVRVGIVVLALIFAGPAVTGDPESVLAKLGSMVLLSLALAATPLLCSIALGVVTIFTRRLRVGRLVELGGQAGRVVSVGLLDVLLRDTEGSDVRVPHLCTLLKPAKLHGVEHRLAVEMCVSSSASPASVQRLLLDAATSFGDRPQVELLDIDADAARYRVSVGAEMARGASDLRLALADVLLREGVPLGHNRYGGRPS
jgi:small-conductance mechanosensitive channel